MADNPDGAEIGKPAESDELQPDDQSDGEQPEGGVDPVTASPQQYPGKPGT
jgi:hypothetical protein